MCLEMVAAVWVYMDGVDYSRISTGKLLVLQIPVRLWPRALALTSSRDLCQGHRLKGNLESSRVFLL